MRGRATASSLALWLLLGADRRLLSLGIVSAFFVGVVAGGLAHPTPAGALVADGDPVETLAQALVTSTVTGVTLVLTLAQLVLSQEQGAAGDQRRRMEDAMTFREDVAGMLDRAVSPTEPSAFLRALVFFDADAFPGGLLGVPYSLLQVAVVVAVALLPFAVLLPYILRIITVAKRTLSIGPFILRETDRDVEFDWQSAFAAVARNRLLRSSHTSTGPIQFVQPDHTLGEVDALVGVLGQQQ